ncbi:MAG: flagellar type III secretion system pore protein FliP [Thermodesulfobacteriota bacterium]
MSSQPRPTSRPGVLTLALILALAPAPALALSLPTLRLGVEEATTPAQVSVLVEILLLFTILTMAPAIMLMMTSFTRLVVIFSFLRNAIGTQQMPPNQVMIGLALFLTFFIMRPVAAEIHTKAIEPYMAETISLEQAVTEAAQPLRAFMFRQTREKDLGLFMAMAKLDKPQNRDDVPTLILIPAYVISELKTAFQVGFVLFLPFLIIDMVVASVLLSMGMMMLPPVLVSLPFKLLLFVLVDGWHLLAGSLVRSFG